MANDARKSPYFVWGVRARLRHPGHGSRLGVVRALAAPPHRAWNRPEQALAFCMAMPDAGASGKRAAILAINIRNYTKANSAYKVPAFQIG